MKDVMNNSTKNFFVKLFSEDPTASSLRLLGALSFIIAVVLACVKLPTYESFLWFAGALYGCKEGRKAVDNFGSKKKSAIDKESMPSNEGTRGLVMDTALSPPTLK
jgi:hypothetical protein